MTRSARPRSTTSLLAIFALVGACGGSQPAPTPLVALPARAPRPAPDTLFADVVPGAVLVVHFDVARLREHPLARVVREVLTQGPLASATEACHGDPLEQVETLTFSRRERGEHTIVLRGPIAEPGAAACADALLEGVMGERLPRRFESLLQRVRVRVNGALLVSSTAGAAAMREAVEARETSAEINPRLAAAREAAGPEGSQVLLDFDVVRATMVDDELPAVPGLDPASRDRLWASLGAVALTVAPREGDALRVSLDGHFASGARAGEARDVAAAQWRTAQTELQGLIRQVEAPDGILPGAEHADARAQIVAVLQGMLERPVFSAASTVARARADLTVGDVGALSALAIPAFVRYMRQAKAAEAVNNLGTLVRQLSVLATTEVRDRRGRVRPPAFPASAPRTPADVPRGVRVVDAPGTWSHPTWLALGFELSDPHYFSYEVVSNGRAFTARAYGDLDGDGVLSTFERVGEITPTGDVQLRPGIVMHQELE